MMFFAWFVLTVVFTVCISVIEGAAKSGEQLTEEKCKKNDVFVAVSAFVTVLVFMIGYYKVQQDPELFDWSDKMRPKVFLSYAMMFSGIYGMITLLIAAIPYAVRKSQGNQQGGSPVAQVQENKRENPMPNTAVTDKVETVFCPKCRRSQRKGNDKCWSCGAALEGDLSPTQKEVVRAQVRVAPQQDMIICPKCGKEQKGNRKCCWDCGAQFVFEEK